MAKELKQKAEEYAINMWGKDEAFIEERTNCKQDYLAGATENGQELQKQIEKMKCCGNCKYSNQESTYSIVCRVGGVDKSDYINTDDNQVCDKWEIRP